MIKNSQVFISLKKYEQNIKQNLIAKNFKTFEKESFSGSKNFQHPLWKWEQFQHKQNLHNKTRKNLELKKKLAF